MPIIRDTPVTRGQRAQEALVITNLSVILRSQTGIILNFSLTNDDSNER